ncbi:DUF4330 domain-containing protein [Halorussus limi]|uniref:DUF4330 domain-containing protein n=1 Tax=Halorussus limi TaxID=2938695 RepID=A0A8U0HWV1_9EURY|nr:DUF4330 domain-containing protein [Halorussus limi]UPV75253.1 DUF4330 domain-containing protein [Halorussus limi]
MDPIDEKGQLFGTVNIIDAFVVFLVLAVIAAGATFILGTENQLTNTTDQLENTTTTVTFEITGVQPYTADAIPEGPLQTDTIVSVQNKSVQPTEIIVKDKNGILHKQTHPRKKTVVLQLTLNTMTTEDDVLLWNKPLEVRRQLVLDFGQVTVKGTVTNFSEEG